MFLKKNKHLVHVIFFFFSKNLKGTFLRIELFDMKKGERNNNTGQVTVRDFGSI